ncbi:C39 family peptidase [Butyrivibrio fibrisolvens]|uniref:C39 family peptidase n=1 Tax=Pseudobutyrivibrio ruminis TaxID=46206 RepID=UPI0004837B1B|nr:papain-like cysteine protease family protein [Pseudobutyrivibrio ruminis]MDC7280633.1 C39 family peptidase [Butyrivibrio fibrisolvens]
MQPLICSMTPGDFTKTGHFIVLTGVTDDGQIIVNDPNSPKNSKKHWDVDILVSQMKSIWKYSYNQ